MAVEISNMLPSDYDAVIALWQATEITIVNDSDSRPAIERYLERNPGMSFVARDNGRIIGAALCGHDGRRGYLHHLAVARSHRRLGIATALVDRCLATLRTVGVTKCHLFVFQHNPEGMTFWQRAGWNKREDLIMMSRGL